ncbi:hypothetical protein L218DRAFT_229912 [Marasmius fiardii PR-910]|nr:hypothetical protein L218DRAFT_229912 [Marasmius fiardii PR-910]
MNSSSSVIENEFSQKYNGRQRQVCQIYRCCIIWQSKIVTYLLSPIAVVVNGFSLIQSLRLSGGAPTISPLLQSFKHLQRNNAGFCLLPSLTGATNRGPNLVDWSSSKTPNGSVDEHKIQLDHSYNH